MADSFEESFKTGKSATKDKQADKKGRSLKDKVKGVFRGKKQANTNSLADILARKEDIRTR